METYRGNWSSIHDLIRDFDITPVELTGYRVLLAVYEYVNYSGNAFVLLINTETNQLYEVNGSHCSCYELEGQWEPEETSPAALRYRIVKGTLGQIEYTNFANDLIAILDAYDILLDEVDEGDTDQLVVVEISKSIGYFTAPKEDRTNFTPDLDDLIDSSCSVYDQKTVRKWEERESSYDFGAALNRHTSFTLNPEVAAWNNEGYDHEITEYGRAENTMVTLYRRRTIECRRTNAASIKELAQWLKNNNGYVVDGSEHNVLEDKIIEVYTQ